MIKIMRNVFAATSMVLLLAAAGPATAQSPAKADANQQMMTVLFLQLSKH
jgi:hypothetical protein